MTQEITREQARELFKQSGLQYSDIGSKEIARLKTILDQVLSEFKNDRFRMKLAKPRSNAFQYNDEGSILRASFRAVGWIEGDTPYFNDREAITFNSDGFIGFSGWADSTNEKPFIEAFVKWIEELKAREEK